MATNMQSYDLKGKKLSFANWISNLSPTETPFVSMTGKEAVNQVEFHWQNDRLATVAKHDHVEGDDAKDEARGATATHINYTQILRKVVKVSDTANVMANYGRGRELEYQMGKAGVAIKRDLEAILLSNQAMTAGNVTTARKTAGFEKLVASKDQPDHDTGAIVHFDTATANTLAFADIEKMALNMYLANSDADIIMFHPKHSAKFTSFQEADSRVKLFSGDEQTFSQYINTYVDAFGKTWKLVPNRFMPQDAIYFFKPSDFTQMVLRTPQRVELAKTGNFSEWMIEMEVGLRLRDQYAAGVLKIKA